MCGPFLSVLVARAFAAVKIRAFKCWAWTPQLLDPAAYPGNLPTVIQSIKLKEGGRETVFSSPCSLICFLGL